MSNTPRPLSNINSQYHIPQLYQVHILLDTVYTAYIRVISLASVYSRGGKSAVRNHENWKTFL